MTEEDEANRARSAILARRARFVAAAMVGAGLSGCGDKTAPSVCLSFVPAPVPSAPNGTGATADGGAPETPAATTTAAPDPVDAGTPRPCLRIRSPNP